MCKENSFLFPMNGDVLNRFDGNEKEGALTILAQFSSNLWSNVTINNITAKKEGNIFSVYITLSKYETELTARNTDTGEEKNIVVYYLPETAGKYRISLDDNILFLKDITEHQDTYKSIFDNPYLAVFKRAHDMYGACTHANLFWEFNEQSNTVFSKKREYFNLSMMTDKFRSEFIENSQWFKMSFHSLADYPENPYKDTTYERMAQDAGRVNQEIIRFAGEESLSSVTTLHYGDTTERGVSALRSQGYKGLAGFFNVTDKNKTVVSYHYSSDLVRHIGKRDFWKDSAKDVIFEKIDIVLNQYNSETVLEQLEKLKNYPNEFGYLSMLMHEQFFYSDYKYYLPDFEKIILCCAEFAVKTGHMGTLFSQLIQ